MRLFAVYSVGLLALLPILQVSAMISGPVQELDAFQMGSNALYLVWKKPVEPNGILLGYNIYYQVIDTRRGYVGPPMQRIPQVRNPEVTKAKLYRLEPGTRYRIYIHAVTTAGEGRGFFMDRTTRSPVSVKPDVPNFSWERIPTHNDMAALKVTWQPNLEGNLGSHFFIKYKLKGESISVATEPELYEDNTEIQGLVKGGVYEMSIVVVDGEYRTESQPREVKINYEGL